GSDTYDIEALLLGTNLTINAGTGGNSFQVTPTTQYLGNLAGPLTLNGGGNDNLVFYDANNPASETYTFDSIPSTLSLASVPDFAVNWTGMGSVTLYTNGMSTVIDPSGTVIVDPPASPSWSGPGDEKPLNGARRTDR